VKVTTVERVSSTPSEPKSSPPEALSYLAKNVNEPLHGLSTAQDGTHTLLEEELRQVEGELQHILNVPFLSGLVGETTTGLLKDREARRSAPRAADGIATPRV
jgi:hypothetical protein